VATNLVEKFTEKKGLILSAISTRRRGAFRRSRAHIILRMFKNIYLQPGICLDDDLFRHHCRSGVRQQRIKYHPSTSNTATSTVAVAAPPAGGTLTTKTIKVTINFGRVQRP